MTIESMVGPILNLGAVGACLILLSVYYLKKDKKYESRIDDRIAAEVAFRRESQEQQERYRQAMEKVAQSLDAAVRVMGRRNAND